LTIHGKVMTSDVPSPGTKQLVAIEIQFADLSNADLARLKAWTLQAIPHSSDCR